MSNHEYTILYWIILIISLFLVIFIIPRLYFYTAEGAITNFYQKDIDRDKYSRDELIDKLYRLSIYDYCKVRWHYTFLLCLVLALFVLYLINGVFDLKNLIILTLLFFVAMEVPNRLENSHLKNKTANKATLIYSTLIERNRYD